MAKELQHEIVKDVTIYYLDLRAFGKGFEEFSEMAKKRFGIKYVRGRVGEVTSTHRSQKVTVFVENTENGQLFEKKHDLVVLSPGIKPPKTLKGLGELFGIQLDECGFVEGSDPLMNPVDTSIPGVFVCGCAEGAKDIPDSVASGSAAAMRASIILSNGGAS